MKELRAAEHSLRGGVGSLRDQRGASLLTRLDLLHSLGLTKQSDGAVYRLRFPTNGGAEAEPYSRHPDARDPSEA
jgi:hypothetical protein